MTFFGCGAYENYRDRQQMKKEGKEILNHPNLYETNH